jgi:antitoxin ParD1/3/4
MNISITPQLLKIVHAKVKSGLYNNASEFIREAIRQFDTNAELLYALKLEHLKKTLEPGINQALAGEYADYSLAKLKHSLNKNPSTKS